MNQKTAGLMKEQLGGKIIKELVALEPMMNSCLADDGCAKKTERSQRNVLSNKKSNSKNTKRI